MPESNFTEVKLETIVKDGIPLYCLDQLIILLQLSHLTFAFDRYMDGKWYLHDNQTNKKYIKVSDYKDFMQGYAN